MGPSPQRSAAPLGWASLVDRAIVVCRAHWRPLLGLAAAWYGVYYILYAATSVPAVLHALTDPAAWSEPAPRNSGLWNWTVLLVGQLIPIGVDAGLVLMACGLLGGRPVSAAAASGGALRKAVVLVLTTILWLLGVALATLACLPALLLTIVPGLGGLLPLVLLLRWASRPHTRTPGRKWSIILLTPFGLLLYWAVRWSLWGPLVMLEGAGPRHALGRSSQLVAGRWFHVALVIGLVSGLLTIGAFLPLLVVPLVTGQTDVQRAWTDDRLIVHVVRIVLGLLAAAVLGPLAPITRTLLLVRLREEREGTDLAERVERLEATPAGVA